MGRIEIWVPSFCNSACRYPLECGENGGGVNSWFEPTCLAEFAGECWRADADKVPKSRDARRTRLNKYNHERYQKEFNASSLKLHKYLRSSVFSLLKPFLKVNFSPLQTENASREANRGGHTYTDAHLYYY